MIRDELSGSPALAGAHIFVAADDGTATLYGSVPRSAQVELAQQLALSVPGIVSVAQEMFVERPAGTGDVDIAGQATRALRRTPRVENIRVTVHNEMLTLTGEVDWQYEREAACRAVRDIDCVQTVVNAIGVHTDQLMAALESRIAADLAGYVSPAEVNIRASANSRGQITLSGAVATSAIRARVLELAWAVPGVTGVVDVQLAIDPAIWAASATSTEQEVRR